MADGSDRVMSLRYPGRCANCGAAIPRGTRAVYSSAAKVVWHIDCPSAMEGTASDNPEAPVGPEEVTEGGVPTPTPVPDPPSIGQKADIPVDRGAAGASAMREFERRKAKDDARILAEKASVEARFGSGLVGRIATLIAVDDRPRSTTSVWAQGAVGEERVAEHLDALSEVGLVLLHDRKIPGTRANIDHLVVTPWGVWVVDAKRYVGKKVGFDVVGAFLGFGGRKRLLVGGRDRSALVEGVEWQLERVSAVAGDSIEVRGCLCFVDSEWPVFGGDFRIRGIYVCWPRKLPKALLRTEAPTLDVETVSRALAAAFPAA